MKKPVSVFLFVFCLISGIKLHGQVSHGAFGAAVIKGTQLIGKSAVIAGGRFGWVIDSSIVVGGGFYFTGNNVLTNYRYPGSRSDYNLGFSYGGLECEYIFPISGKISASLQIFFGGGGGKFLPADGVSYSPYGFSAVVIEPQFSIEAGINKWLHASAGAGYRYVSGFDEYYFYKPKDLSGFSGMLTFKFGSY